MLVLEIETIKWFPGIADLRLQHEVTFVLEQPEKLVRRGLRRIGDEAQRRRQREPTKTNIGDISFGPELDQQQHVTARPNEALRRVPHDACCERVHLETKLPQHVAEEQIVLEAVPAAALLQQLPLEGRKI